MAFSDAFLAKLREHADRARHLFSNPRKPERERMVVRAFLRCVGETFEGSEIIASREEPIDVRFRTADFQIMEIVGDRKRGLDWRRRQDRYRDAQHVADVMEPYTPSQPMSFDDAAQFVANGLSAKAARYGAAACADLDALVYIDLHNQHLWPLEPAGNGRATAMLLTQGWRSTSMLFVPYGVVLLAAPTAPAIIRARAGRVLSEWPGPDGLFDP
ncbi:MAG: DUF1780 domain-containing protein [Pseudomonadota bacterium]